MSLRLHLPTILLAALAVAGWAATTENASASGTGGMAYQAPSRAPAAHHAQATDTAPTATAPVTPPPTAPATVDADGHAVAPAGAPPAVVALIAAGNQIAGLPYRYGGGHGSFTASAYDCSGSVSFALHGAGLLASTLDSTALSRWGMAGPGTWISIYANKTHTYLVVAGLRFDTSGRAAAGTRWQASPRTGKGFAVRHPSGL